MSEEFDLLIRSAFPATVDISILRVVAQGVALADDTRRNTSWLSSLIGDDLRGNLRRAATMWSFKQACQSGELPFEAIEIANSNRSSHLLQINSGKFEAHIVRTESDRSFPRDAIIRQDKSLTNEPDLFKDGQLDPLDIQTQRTFPYYAWLSFNADIVGNLTHVGWAMPSAEKKEILGFVQVLRTDAQRGEFSSFDEHSPPRPDPMARARFRADVEQALEDENNKDATA
jgi:hypothetical protein